MKRFKSQFVRDLSGALGEIADVTSTASAPAHEADAEYGVIEKAAERKITYGIMYASDLVDVHGEYAKESDLEEACQHYLANGDTRIRKQHGTRVIGDLIGLMPWPFEQTVELRPIDGLEKSATTKTLPPYSVYMAVQWTDEGWEDVKKGNVKGFSMGGKAVRTKDAGP
jgi:hypothetical protein